MSHSTSSNLPAKSPMQHAQETFDLVKSHVHQLGGWRNVLSFYPEFHEALEKAPRSVKCPFTGDGKTKFRLKTVHWKVFMLYMKIIHIMHSLMALI